MKTWVKIAIGFGVVGTGVAAYYFFIKKPALDALANPSGVKPIAKKTIKPMPVPTVIPDLNILSDAQLSNMVYALNSAFHSNLGVGDNMKIKRLFSNNVFTKAQFDQVAHAYNQVYHITLTSEIIDMDNIGGVPVFWINDAEIVQEWMNTLPAN